MNYSILNQFMLYLGVEELKRDDLYVLLLTFSHNQQLEFKHIIWLIGQGRIEVSKSLKDHIMSRQDIKWCLDITPDFEYNEVI